MGRLESGPDRDCRGVESDGASADDALMEACGRALLDVMRYDLSRRSFSLSAANSAPCSFRAFLSCSVGMASFAIPAELPHLYLRHFLQGSEAKSAKNRDC